jgi:hypothetical protein
MHTAPEPLLREYPRTDPRLGRKLHLDARSIPFISKAADPRALRSVHWPRPLPILDQGDLGGHRPHPAEELTRGGPAWCGASVRAW